MAGPSPTIDRRDLAAILQEVRTLAPFYTPEWDAVAETGAGAALLRVFATLFEGLLRRLNDVPQRNFIAFLNTLGVQLLPAQSARVPLTFALSTGTPEAVVIPAGSQAVAMPSGGGDPIVFETEQTILATPAHLQAVFSIVPGRDQIFDHSTQVQGSATAALFADTTHNLQEHILYLGDTDRFNLKAAGALTLTVNASQPQLLRSSSVQWEWWGKIGTAAAAPEQWHPFTVSGRGNAVTLTKSEGAITVLKVDDITNRWIRCRATTGVRQSDVLAALTITALGAMSEPQNLIPDAVFANDIPLPTNQPMLPFGIRPRQGDTFYLASQQVFSKKGARVTFSPTAQPSGVVGLPIERVLGIGKNFRDRLQSRGIHTTTDLLQRSVNDIAEIIRNTQRNIPASSYLTRARNILEAATKEYYDKVVTQGGEGDLTLTTPRLSWEYWNGQGWVTLPDVVDNSGALLRPLTVSFTCPDDLAVTRVGGQENYWIRVRIAAGDYGQEKYTMVHDATADRLNIDTSDIHPPQFASVTLSYTLAAQPPMAITLNNLHYTPQTVPFSPFVPLDDAHQALYLGFDRAPLQGSISLFFSLTEQEYSEHNQPHLMWEYYRQHPGAPQGEWARLDVVDGTHNLTESGTVAFIGPADFVSVSRFGQARYWIRAVDVQDAFQSRQNTLIALLPRALQIRLSPLLTSQMSMRSLQVATLALRGPSGAAPGSELAPCAELLASFRPAFALPRAVLDVPAAPLVQGLYLNTAWAIQAETIRNEILGSSSGILNQRFTLSKFPVLSEAIWVNELSALSEGERQTLVARADVATIPEQNTQGQMIALWVRWQAVADLLEAQGTGRVYTIDRTFGQLQFGDGVHGMVPPLGRDNLRATYQAGGGARGNVPAARITGLRTTMPFVERVVNPEPAGGGSDTEVLARALERGPQMLKHRGRAITAEDFEWIAREASRAVARVKCLPTFDDQGQFATGWVMVIIVPANQADRPLPSPQLRRRVATYIRERAANVVIFPEHVQVVGPMYIEAHVTATLFPRTIDLAPQVEAQALRQLTQFLHPLTGGSEGCGWEFGRLPCLSDFYTVLEVLDGVDYASNLSLTLRAVTPTGEILAQQVVREDRPVAVSAPEYTLICSGEHHITVQVLR